MAIVVMELHKYSMCSYHVALNMACGVAMHLYE